VGVLVMSQGGGGIAGGMLPPGAVASAGGSAGGSETGAVPAGQELPDPGVGSGLAWLAQSRDVSPLRSHVPWSETSDSEDNDEDRTTWHEHGTPSDRAIAAKKRAQDLEYTLEQFRSGSGEICRRLLHETETGCPLADIALLCDDGTRLMVHENILCGSCEQFRAMFDKSARGTSMREARDRVVPMPKYASRATVEAFRQWMYEGELHTGCRAVWSRCNPVA
jgi:hypothetical protein